MNLPPLLQQEATQFAQRQGISLDQFVLWAVAEKVGALKQQSERSILSEIVVRVGASGIPYPVLKGTSIRVQTIAIAHYHWQLSPSQIASEYDLTETQILTALIFYETHRAEIDTAIASEQATEPAYV